MKCIKCGKEVTDKEFMERKMELEKTYGIIARTVPMCSDCRNKPQEPMIIKRIK